MRTDENCNVDRNKCRFAPFSVYKKMRVLSTYAACLPALTLTGNDHEVGEGHNRRNDLLWSRAIWVQQLRAAHRGQRLRIGIGSDAPHQVRQPTNLSAKGDRVEEIRIVAHLPSVATAAGAAAAAAAAAAFTTPAAFRETANKAMRQLMPARARRNVTPQVRTSPDIRYLVSGIGIPRTFNTGRSLRHTRPRPLMRKL